MFKPDSAYPPWWLFLVDAVCLFIFKFVIIDFFPSIISWLGLAILAAVVVRVYWKNMKDDDDKYGKHGRPIR